MENEPLITLDEIMRALLRDGLKLSRRTFQYYVQSGLLPKGIRKGHEKGGVQFYYPAPTVFTIKRIFELKEEGRNLSSIKEIISSSSSYVVPYGINGRREEGGAGRKAYSKARPGFELLCRVMRLTPGGEALQTCLQCGTCGGSCPSSSDMDHTPRKLFSMLLSGLTYEVLSSNTPWFCVSCYYCTVRCPQRIPITEIMYTLKELAVREGMVKITDAYDFSKTFVNLVEKYGRSFDFGLALRYHLTHHPMGRGAWGSLVLRMYKKERMVTGPSKIKDIDNFIRILEKAKELGERR
jgi:heterodisulfide reductase subunit C2